MTPEQIDMVKDSWEKVIPISEKAAKIFYARLFELKPAFKSLFKHDMKEQGRKLMAALTTVVNSLENLADIIVPVQEMGRRHAAYDVKEDDYSRCDDSNLFSRSSRRTIVCGRVGGRRCVEGTRRAAGIAGHGIGGTASANEVRSAAVCDRQPPAPLGRLAKRHASARRPPVAGMDGRQIRHDSIRIWQHHWLLGN